MRDKLKSFERQQTTWEGLWYQPKWLGFSSAVIDLSKLKAFKGILYVRKNKYYKEGSNRPNYVFSVWRTSDGERLYTHSETLAAVSNAIDDTRYYSYDDMFAEYYLR